MNSSISEKMSIFKSIEELKFYMKFYEIMFIHVFSALSKMRWSKLGAPLYLMNILLFMIFLITLNVTAYLSPAPFMISPVNGNVCQTGEVALIDDPFGDSTSWYCYS